MSCGGESERVCLRYVMPSELVVRLSVRAFVSMPGVSLRACVVGALRSR